MFKYKYDTIFIWIDVEKSALNCRVDMRVDQMVNAGDIEQNSDFTAEDFCLQEQSVFNRRVDMRVDQMVNAGVIEPDSNFTAEDFCLQAIVYVEKFLKTQSVPIIFGDKSVLNRRVDMRIEQMVSVDADYTKGIQVSPEWTDI
ncbi:hypothetical protein RDI58_010700 [Solanum bulbocastanum]|uniref:Uncharacterized protein n=1 Tax=Solanum bulbocastanum TaxID=147425 RepID=A0AAN8YFM2_SOLBU